MTSSRFGTTSTPFDFTARPLATAVALAAGLVLGLPSAVSANEETALRALLNATGGDDSPLARDWASGLPCNWRFVTCDDTNRVTKLSLANLELTGQLPEEISALTSLQVLDLSNNAFEGGIPAKLGELTSLQTLRLDLNRFDGAVPASLKNLTSLKELDLSYNMLESSGDEAADSFLAEVQGSDWSATQTIAPVDLKITATTIDSITLEWTPIAYAGDGGGYEIIVSPDTRLVVGEDRLETVVSKQTGRFTVSGLMPSSSYHFAIRAFSENIPGKGGDWKLVSGFSSAVSGFTLLDTDRDGTADIDDPDADNDGIPNEQEGSKDSDNDGIPDYLENNKLDTDGDGTPDYLDADDDGDGTPTSDELGSTPGYPADSDDDGIRDYLDKDSKNDGGMADGSGDSDGDGLSDKEECPDPASCADTDGDGLANYMDRDDDNDGRGTDDEGATLDSDSDGIIDALENNRRDTDGDGRKDHEDADDDGDGRPTRDELGASALSPIDKDGDGIPDYLDADADNKANTKDGSGDSDGDGISDTGECPSAPDCADNNSNGIPAYMDKNEIVEIKSGKVLGDEESRGSGGGALGGFGLLTAMLSLAAIRRRRNTIH